MVASSAQAMATTERSLLSSVTSILAQFAFELSGHTSAEEESDDESFDSVDQKQRAERLKDLLPAFQQQLQLLPGFGAHQDFNLATEKLADSSREPIWRVPLGESGILELFLPLLGASSVSDTLRSHILRLVGNCCADTDENRERIVAAGTISAIKPLLEAEVTQTSLHNLAIPVLYNICIDYEPAQKQASALRISETLLGLVERIPDLRNYVGYICKLLDLLIVQQYDQENGPEDAAILLSDMSVKAEIMDDVEDYISIATTASNYLQHPRYQEPLLNAEKGGFDSVIKIMHSSYTRFPTPDEDTTASLTALRTNINTVLSDLSALPSFAVKHPVISPFSGKMLYWLSQPYQQLQIGACIMLGNVGRSDTTCIDFVHKLKVHVPLMNILATAADGQLLYAVLSFLKNLALPAQNKPVLGDAGIMDHLEKLWELDTQPQVQYSTLSLVRQLCTNCFPNIARICGHLSLDPDSPAYKKSQLTLILAVFNRTDSSPCKMEIARLYTAICRNAATNDDNDPTQIRRRKNFFEKHPEIARPIGYMVSQKEWPAIRSEGWFVMALISRLPEGAVVIADIMHDASVFQPLVELLTGKDFVNGDTAPSSPDLSALAAMSTSSPTEEAEPKPLTAKELELQRIDRENALVMVSELLKHRGHDMAFMRKAMFEDLLKGGAGVHVSYKEAMSGTEEIEGGSI